jgi:amidase
MYGMWADESGHDAFSMGASDDAGSDGLHWWTARRLAGAMRTRELAARDVMRWHLERIEAINPRVNAIVSLRADAAMAEAAVADERAARGGERLGPLHGLPIVMKDLEDTAGIRTTYGSLTFADNVPAVDSLVVQRLRGAGAIVVGKTNTPEFGVGSHTFKERITVSAHPVAAVPAGLTDSELPVGIQFVGRYGDDRRLLEHAAAWETASGLTDRHPRWTDGDL